MVRIILYMLRFNINIGFVGSKLISPGSHQYYEVLDRSYYLWILNIVRDSIIDPNRSIKKLTQKKIPRKFSAGEPDDAPPPMRRREFKEGESDSEDERPATQYIRVRINRILIFPEIFFVEKKITK